MFFFPGEALFMENSLPTGLRGPAVRFWLEVAWGSLSPAGVSPAVLPSADAISMLVGPKTHTPTAGAVSSMEPRACGLETSLASWRVSHAHFSESEVDGLMVPMTIQSALRAILALSASSLGLSASVVVLSLPSSLALFATELLVPHIQTPSVVLDTPLIVEVRLSGLGAVAQVEVSTWLNVPAATVPVVPGVCLPLAEAVLLLAPGVRATLCHPVLCPSVVRVVPGVQLLAAGDAVPAAAGVTLGLVL